MPASDMVYRWTRFWAPRESAMHLDIRGYLQDPEAGDGQLLNPHVVPLANLLTRPCLVLLGEPGAGKTRALDDVRASEEERITRAGENSLWIDMRDVASAEALSKAVFEHEKWRQEPALHVFLDSLDETPMGIEAIVRPLLQGLDTRAPDKVRLRVVCRTAEWPAALERGLQSRWPDAAFYEIAPLRRVDVESAARTHGLDPATALFAIAEREVQAFALRPFTLSFLLTRLSVGQSLPKSKVELYATLCRSLCDEPSNSRPRNNVSPEERLALAERIGASLLFGGRGAVFVDVDLGQLLDGDLPVAQLTGDLELVEGDLTVRATMPAVRDALATGLFNSRGRGRQAFAHYSFAEFLAARYVRKHRLPQAQTRSLLLHPGLERVVPHLHGTAAWLASMDREFFEFVLERDPHVLLEADAAMFDTERKKRLVELVLERYDKREHLDRDFFRREPFEKLAFDGIDSVLRPYIRGKKHDAMARRVATLIAETCNTTAVIPDLLAVLQDGTDALNVRSSAAYAISEIGGAADHAALRPFANGDDSDLRDDLKGCALSTLWPGMLSIRDVLGALTPARDRFTIGRYQVFFQHEVAPRATDEELVTLLEWTVGQDTRAQLPEPAHGLVDDVMTHGWERLNRPGLLQAFTRAAYGRIRHDDVPLLERIGREDPWFKEETKRRCVLRSLLAVCDDTQDVRFRLRQLLGTDDFGFLVGLLESELNPQERSTLVKLLHDATMWSAPFEMVDPLVTAATRHPDLAEALRPLFDAWPVDGPLAQEARAVQARLRAIMVDRSPRVTVPPVSERVCRLLDKFDAGDSTAYWQIDFQLGVDERGYEQLTALHSDLKKLPGWVLLDEGTRARLLAAAAKYLAVGKCSPEKWIGQSHYWNPALSGYRALRILQSERRTSFDALTPEMWAEWAPIIGGFPGLDEAKARRHGLLVEAYRHAPDAVLEAVLAAAVADDASMGRVFAHRRLEPVWDERVGVALLEFLKRPLKPGSVEEILGTVLAHDVPGAVGAAEAMVHLPVPVDGDERARVTAACACLMREALASAWPLIQRVLTADPVFGREIVGEVARFADVRPKAITHSLPERDCIALLEWLEAAFPHFEDPDIKEAHAVGVREQVAHLRTSVLRDLTRRGSLQALDALQAAEQQNPQLPYLRWAVLEAEYHTLSRTWSPVAPAALRALARDGSKRLVSDEDGLLEVVVASLLRLGERLQGESRSVRFLWDKQRVDGSFVPVDENVFSDFVREHLEADIIKSGIVLNREVQLRPSVAKGTGQRTDIHINALALDPVRRQHDVLTLVVETKGAWSAELLTAMKTQLRDRYLTGTRVRRGVYLSGWFSSALWASDDERRSDVPGEGRDAISTRLAQQARELSTDGVRIASVVIDASLPGEPGATSRPTRPARRRAPPSKADAPPPNPTTRGPSRRANTKTNGAGSAPAKAKQERTQSPARRGR